MGAIEKEEQKPIAQTKLIPIKKVCEIAGIGKTEVYSRMKSMSFPKSVKISTKCVRWSESEIQEWANTQLSKRFA